MVSASEAVPVELRTSDESVDPVTPIVRSSPAPFDASVIFEGSVASRLKETPSRVTAVISALPIFMAPAPVGSRTRFPVPLGEIVKLSSETVEITQAEPPPITNVGVPPERLVKANSAEAVASSPINTSMVSFFSTIALPSALAVQ